MENSSNRSRIYLLVGLWHFWLLVAAQLVFATFIYEDYSFIYFSRLQGGFEFWTNPLWMPADQHYRPFTGLIFDILTKVSWSPWFYQAVVALFLCCGGIAICFGVQKLSRPGGSFRFGPSLCLVLFILGVASSSSDCVRFATAGFHDGLIFFFSAVLFAGTFLRDRADKRMVRFFLTGFGMILVFLAASSKENGLLTPLIPLSVSFLLAVGDEKLTIQRTVRSLWLSLKLNWALFVGVGVYLYLRFAVAGIPFASKQKLPTDLWSRIQRVFQTIGESFFYPEVAIPSVSIPAALLLIWVLLPTYLALRREWRVLCFASMMILLGIAPMTISFTYGYNQWMFALVGILAAIVVVCDRLVTERIVGNYPKILISAVFLVVIGTAFLSKGASIRYAAASQTEFIHFADLLVAQRKVIRQAIKKGRPVQLVNFPTFKGDRQFLYMAFLQRDRRPIPAQYPIVPGAQPLVLTYREANGGGWLEVS